MQKTVKYWPHVCSKELDKITGFFITQYDFAIKKGFLDTGDVLKSVFPFNQFFIS